MHGRVAVAKRRRPDFKVYGVEPVRAAHIAKRFAKDYCDAKPGVYFGTIYSDNTGDATRDVYAYWTKARTIVISAPWQAESDV